MITHCFLWQGDVRSGLNKGEPDLSIDAGGGGCIKKGHFHKTLAILKLAPNGIIVHCSSVSGVLRCCLSLPLRPLCRIIRSMLVAGGDAKPFELGDAGLAEYG